MKNFTIAIILTLLGAVNNLCFAQDNAKELFYKYKETTDTSERRILREQIITLSPDSEYGLLMKGVELWKKDNNKGAVDFYTKAIKKRPAFKEAYFYRALVYRDLKEFTNAKLDYKKAIEIDPEDASGYLEYGIFLANHFKSYDEAVDYINLAIEKKPDDARAYYNRGINHYNLDKYSDALTDYTKAIEINPLYTEAYFKRATIYIKLKDNDNAISDLTSVIGIDPKADHAYNKRGRIYFELKQYDKAVDDFNEAISIDPFEKLYKDSRDVTLRKLNKQ